MKKLILTFLSLAIVAAAGNVMAYFELSKYSELDFIDRIGTKDSGDGYDIDYFGYLGNDDKFSWSGYYLGTAKGNDNGVIEDTIRYYLGKPSDAEVVIDKDENIDSSLTIQSTDGKRGTFSVSTTDADDPDGIEFYAVKGANEWALYFLDPAKSSGFWSTEHLLTGNDNKNNNGRRAVNIPEISHFTASLVDLPDDPGGSNAVPEPTTMLLFGTGLLGLAGWGRRKKHF